ncbi:hypothetical protein ACFVTP_07150 [Streptomyces celluloflavus]|uniref:hypothetical protein n=1 Tax=Streptomyces celluloflavus TaxID=58344 RepID=UPI0036DCA24F
MRRRRARAALTSLAVLVPLALGSGCASLEGLKSDGRAREVKAPLALWPEYSPAPPNREDNPAALKPVPGVPRIPGGDMTAADPLAVLDADLAAEGRPPPDPKTVRRPLLYDLTDSGKPDLITVVDLDRRTSELRVYSVRDQVVTRVLFVRGVLAGVELAAGHLAVRQPTEDPRYQDQSQCIGFQPGGEAILSLALTCAVGTLPHCGRCPPKTSGRALLLFDVLPDYRQWRSATDPAKTTCACRTKMQCRPVRMF